MKNPLLRAAVWLSYYPSFAFNRLMVLLGIWRRWDWVDADVLLGAVPARADIPRLAAMGIGAIVNMCEEFAGFQPEMTAAGITQLYLPTLDYHSPSAADMLRGVRFMREHVAAGRKVFVHCKAGRGRSATLTVCYLMAAHGITAKQAHDRIKAARPHVNAGVYRRSAVREFERSLTANREAQAAVASNGNRPGSESRQLRGS